MDIFKGLTRLENIEYLAKNRKYKVAETYYILGEIYYQTNQYTKGIAAFKESIKIDDKASYVPTLLFHTAIAFQKINKLKKAGSFYQTLITLYPKHQLSKYARQRLAKLQ